LSEEDNFVESVATKKRKISDARLWGKINAALSLKIVIQEIKHAIDIEKRGRTEVLPLFYSVYFTQQSLLFSSTNVTFLTTLFLSCPVSL